MQTLGIIDIVWRGRNIPVEKGAKFNPGGIKNKAVHYGRKTARAQEYMGAMATATSNLERGQRWGNTWDAGEGELQIVCDTGQTYVMDDAFLTDIPDITGDDGGKFELKWEGSPAEEILS